MNLQLNGTGASEGFPSLFCSCPYCQEARKLGGKNIRHRTSSCIDGRILIDFSADTFSSCAQHKVDLSQIHHLIVTHSHADHFSPVDLHYLLPPFCDHPHPLNIYGNAAVHQKLLNEHKENPGLLSHISFYELKAGEAFWIDDYKIIPVPTLHDRKENCFIYIVEKGQKKLLYAHDSAPFPEETWVFLQGHIFSMVILDCTSVEKGSHFPNHMGLPDNIAIKERMLSEHIAHIDTRFVLTHFAHTFNPLDRHVSSLAEANGFIAAYDGILLNL